MSSGGTELNLLAVLMLAHTINLEFGNGLEPFVICQIPPLPLFVRLLSPRAFQ